MSRFYGVLSGERGDRTKRGHKTLRATAASWSGAVYAEMYIGDNGEERVRVGFTPWEGVGVSKVLYDGPIEADEETFAESAVRWRLCLNGSNWEPMSGADAS